MAASAPHLRLVRAETDLRFTERAFLPVALEAMETPPSPLGRTLAMMLCALVVIGIVWASIGKLDIVAVASGKIVAHTRTKIVQPFEISTVKAILVTAGQTVHAGDPLIELDPVTADAERARAHEDLVAAKLDQMRLVTFFEGDKAAQFAQIAEVDQTDVDRAEAQLIAQRAEAKAKLATLTEQRAQRVAERDSLKLTLTKAEDVLPIVYERAEIRRKSAALEFGSRLLSLETQQQYVEAKAEIEIERAKIASLDAAIDGIDHQVTAYQAELRKTALSDLSHAREQEGVAKEALAKANHRVALQTLRSPIDGTVQQVNVSTVGSVVTPAQQLLSVVPQDDRVEVEAVLENRDVGFVSAGQTVELKIDAYPFTRYGLAKGTILSVDRDAEAAPLRQSQEGSQRAADAIGNIEASEKLLYTVHISVDRNSLMLNGAPAPLVPGMAVKAEILTGSRRIIDYVLAPLSEYRHDSLRER